jgi:YHS domain-containing protein
MKQFLTLAAVFGALTSAALAAPQKTGKPTAKAAAKSAVPKCPHCKMTLTTKKDKTHTAATKVNGKTYYCCAGCDMDKSAKKDAKATAKAAKKAAKAPMCPKCNMQMSFTKSPLKNTAMKVKGTTYYCCTICPKH